MLRSDIYKVIDGERDYQDKMWGVNGENRPKVQKAGEGPNHSVGNFIVFIDEYVDRAKKKLTTDAGHESALDMLRKVAGLCVACFEQHGVPVRQ